MAMTDGHVGWTGGRPIRVYSGEQVEGRSCLEIVEELDVLARQMRTPNAWYADPSAAIADITAISTPTGIVASGGLLARWGDGDIRQALHQQLTQEHRHEPTTRFIDELDLCGLVRVDVAVVNDTLAGYELKSDVDTLRRLPQQIKVYSDVLDKATLVVGEKHYQEALKTLPPRWGVIVASGLGDITVLETQRPAEWNDEVNPVAVAQLLWRAEALDELVNRGLDRGVRSKPRRLLWERLASEVPLSDLREAVRRRLKEREAWRVPVARV